MPEVLVHALAWHAEDEIQEDDGSGDEDGEAAPAYVIHAFGRTIKGDAVRVSIEGFKPHFFIKIPSTWTHGDLRRTQERLEKLRSLPTRVESHRDFLGFRDDKEERFIRAEFPTLKAMRVAASVLRDSLRLYESGLDPLLVFMHARDLSPADWISVDDRYFCRHGQFRVPWQRVSRADGKGRVAPFRVMSFDIECQSCHGDFPEAKKTWKKFVFDLKAAFKRFAARESAYDSKRFIEQCVLAALGHLRVDGISEMKLKGWAPGAFALSRESLARLADDLYAHLRAPAPGISSIDPDAMLSELLPAIEGDEIIQIGASMATYGVEPLRFDVRHVFALGQCDCTEGLEVSSFDSERDLLLAWADFVGRSDPDVVIGYNILGFDMEYIFVRASELGVRAQLMRSLSRLAETPATYTERTLSSSALGDNNLKLIDMPGRIVADVMKLIQRDHKLDSYKLDDVAELFTGDRKNDVSPADIFRLQRGSAADRGVIAAYCAQDCDLVLRLAWKLHHLSNNMGMANVCSVPLMFIFMRGQGVKIFSLVSKQCRRDGLLVPTLKRVADGAADDGYEGAIVLDPRPGIYMEPVSVLDYASLYPSSMISENLSHDCLVMDPAFDNIPGVEYVEVRYDEYAGAGAERRKAGERVCRFAQKAPGVIPRILSTLVERRTATRLAAKKAGDPFERAVLEGLQLAYKVTANSLYGSLGARTSPLYLKDVAACTTSVGRTLILRAKAFVEEHFGAQVIYGDTDSIFCVFDNKDEAGARLSGERALGASIRNGEAASAAFRPRLKPPHDLEYEKTFFPFVILSKKRYVGNVYARDPAHYERKSMGIVLKRRDNANIVKKVYGGVIDIILGQRDVGASVAFFKTAIRDLVDGRTPIHDLVITKSLRSTYKEPDKIAHYVLAQRMGERDPGNKPQPGERIKYVYVVKPNALLQGERIEHPDYVARHNLPVDFKFYIEHQLMKPITQLYSIMIDELEGATMDVKKQRQKLLETPAYAKVEKAEARLQALREREVQRVLFDPVLREIDCTRSASGNHKITDYFTKCQPK